MALGFLPKKDRTLDVMRFLSLLTSFFSDYLSKFREINADLIILALGFVKESIPNYLTSQKDIFICGDMRRGPSLIVWAIAEGRNSANAIDEYLNS